MITNLSGASLTTLDLIAPVIAGAENWKFFADQFNPVYQSENRVIDQTHGVSEGKYGGYDGWLIVENLFPVLDDSNEFVYRPFYDVYRVTGSFIFPVEF